MTETLRPDSDHRVDRVGDAHVREPQTDEFWQRLALEQAHMRRQANARAKQAVRTRRTRLDRERAEALLKRQACSLCGKGGVEKQAGTRLCRWVCAELGEVSGWLVEHGVDPMASDAIAKALYDDYINVERY